MDLGAPEMRLYWDMAQFTATAAVGIYVYFSQRSQARREALVAMERRVDESLDALGSRLGRIELRLATAPEQSTCAAAHVRMAALETRVAGGVTVEDIKRAHMRIDTVSEAVADLRGTLRRIERTMDMINQYLVERGGHE